MGLIPIILILVAYFIFDPNIDMNTETGEYILWYNWFGKRKNIKI